MEGVEPMDTETSDDLRLELEDTLTQPVRRNKSKNIVNYCRKHQNANFSLNVQKGRPAALFRKHVV